MSPNQIPLRVGPSNSGTFIEALWLVSREIGVCISTAGPFPFPQKHPCSRRTPSPPLAPPPPPQKAFAVLQGSLEAKEHVLGDLSPEAAETYRVLNGANLALKNPLGTHPKLKKVK